MRRRDPKTPEEWQEAVNAAEFYLSLDACRQYGLVTGGPGVNAARCEEILRRGKWRGIRPAPFDELVKAYLTPEPQTAP
jgi:hypothetical protein